MLRISIAIAVVVLILSCSVFAEKEIEKPKWGEIETWEWEYQPPTDYHDADAVVLFDYGKVEVELRGKQLKRHLRLKVFNPGSITSIFTPMYRSGDLRDIDIKYYLNPESTYTPKEKFYNEHEGFQWCYAEKTIENVQSSGFIVELEYTIDYDSTYLPEWFFDSEWYTLKSIYIVSIGGCYNYSYWSENIPSEKSEPIETRGGGLVGSFYRVFNWQLDDMPPFDKTENTVRREVSPILYFTLRFHGNSTLSNMEPYSYMDNVEIAIEFIPKMKDYFRKYNGIKTLVKTAVADVSDKHERAAAIYNYVCDEVVTLPSVAIDEYHHKFLERMIEAGEGTELEKSLLLIKMLDKIGVEAWPVLISTKDHGSYNIQYPDRRQFNHLIIRAEIYPDEFVFCDLSQDDLDFGQLPENANVSGGLLIHDKNPNPIRVK